ncbi:MAG: amidohydrolase family protein [Acidimicrobiia bacterium]
MAYDLVIRNGSVVDGSGEAAYRADIGVEGGRIRTVGRIPAGERATREIDADGLTVTPGFIDPHTHLDAQMFWDHAGANSCWHGVTTAVMGNCGFTIAPGSEAQADLIVRNLERAEDMSAAVLAAGIDWSWTTYPEYLDTLDRLPKGINYIAQVGHSAVRCHVMGERAFHEEATAEELALMERHVRDAITSGAWGFTTSRTKNHLTPAGDPVASRVAAWSEIERLLDVASDAGAIVYQYVEDPPKGPDARLEHEEMLFALSAKTGLSFVIPTMGPAEMVFSLLDRAAAAGASFIGVNHPRGIGNWSSFKNRMPFDAVPEWAAIRSQPLEQQRAVLLDPDRRAALVTAALNHTYAVNVGAEARPPDYDHMRVMTGPTPPWPTVNEVAAQRGLDPVSTIIELSLESDFDHFFVQRFGNVDMDNSARLIAHPSIVTGFSDSGAHVSQMADASITSHLLAHFVRERQLVPLEAAVRSMTGSIATKWGIAERGFIREGYVADLNVLDPDTVGPAMPAMRNDLPADGQRIEQRSTGYRATIVAGAVLIDDGEYTGAHPGALLRRGRASVKG